MHDLHAMYEKALDLCKEHFDGEVTEEGNFWINPRASKMSDLQVMALAIAAESASIDSENLLFSKLRTDYQKQFPFLIDRTRFNRRRRGLRDKILELTKRISLGLDDGSDIDIVDSMPCPIVKNSREKNYRICKEDPDTAPAKGYSAVNKHYFIGYKLHLLTNEHGLFQDMQITAANVHDINFLKRWEPEPYSKGKTILGDKGYISQKVQTDLFTEHLIELKVPYRRNQYDYRPADKALGRKRRRIETQFAQLCDQFRLKINYAKSFAGLLTRIISKLAAVALLQMVNMQKGRPINHLRHAWS